MTSTVRVIKYSNGISLHISGARSLGDDIYTANIFAPISGAKTSVTIYNLRFPSHVTEKALRMVLPSSKYEKVTASNAVLFTSHS